jgi:potassium-dependent mechanosensitive channel
MIGRQRRHPPAAARTRTPGPRGCTAATRLLFLLALAWLAPCATPAVAQQQDAPTVSPPSPAPLPDPLEITSRLRTVTDSAAIAEAEIARLAQVGGLLEDLERARGRQAELEQLVVGTGEAEFVRADRINRVRSRAVAEAGRLALLDERVSERLRGLGQIRAEWVQRQRFWMQWRDALRDDAEFAIFRPELARAVEQTEQVRRQVAAQLPELLSLQREVQSLRLQTDRTVEMATTALGERRATLLRRDQPVLGSPAFLQQLAREPETQWRAATALRGEGYLTFVTEQSLLVGIHLVLVLFLGLTARQLRRQAVLTAGWAELLRHPWAAALFASTALVAQQYVLAPPLVEVLVWTVLAAAGVVLARLMVESQPLRRMVYWYSAFYPLFLLAEAVWLQPPLFQAGLAGAAVLGLAYFALLTRRSARQHGEPTHARWLIGFGAAMWGVVLVAEIVGFHRLSRWVIHSAITTALVLFVVGFLIIVARGLLWTLLNVEARERFRVAHTVGVALAERVLRLVQAVLVVAAVLALLNIWELAASPIETWTRITGLGFMVAGAEVTIGRVLFAILLVYLALLASWLARTVVSSEVVPRWDLDQGVGESITAVIHYVAIAIGILIALGALGVHLQNIAIVAGALSVGIGFGLQNVVNNFVSGIILLFERPVRVGDTVVIGGEWGTIRKIGLRSTRVETFDRSEMIVPNGDLVSEKVTNWTLSNPIARLTLPVGVAYGSPVSRVMQILREAATVHPAVLDDPSPQALFMGFGDSSLDFELRVWVRELRHRLEVKSLILEELDRRFRDEGIEVPFPQRDLHLRSLDPAILAALRRVEHERPHGGEPSQSEGREPPQPATG